MKAYVVVDKKGKIVKTAGISFCKDCVFAEGTLIDEDDKEFKPGEKVKSFTIPELK